MTVKSGISICVTAAAIWATPISAQDPLSAIDWLNDTAALPENFVLDPILEEAKVTAGIQTEAISVTSLDAISSDATGLIPTSVTGLPADLWGTTSSAELASLFRQLPDDLAPALQGFVRTVLLAELNPPADSDPEGALFLARVDTLIRLGAVNEAQAILERAGTNTPERFDRWFDVSLLTGTEVRPCAALRENPQLSSAIDKRIFCLARGGDWSAAAVTLETSRILGDLPRTELALLTRFLADDIEEHDGRVTPTRRPTPLVFRLHEAIGEPLATTDLPLAFAHADLNANVGWKAQIEAAERLAREGAISENLLLGLYTERSAAASGGVWDRVDAIQALDNALTLGQPDGISTALPVAWDAMVEAKLTAPFAAIYADRLVRHQLSKDGEEIAFKVALLSPNYEELTADKVPNQPHERFLKAIARGDVAGVPTDDEISQAVSDGFTTLDIDSELKALVDDRNLGAALLVATEMMCHGTAGNLLKLSQSIAFFRSVGLEDLARRGALHALVLDGKG